MKITRRTQIRIETTRRIAALADLSPAIVYCPFCLEGEVMPTAENAARELGINRRRVYQMLEIDGARFLEQNGQAFLCANWLKTAFQQLPES